MASARVGAFGRDRCLSTGGTPAGADQALSSGVMLEFRQPVAIITKNRLVARDIDVLGELAGHNAAGVFVSVTSLDDELVGRLEPRTTRPSGRLNAIRALASAGIPVGVMVAPIIPGLTEHEMPAILESAQADPERAGRATRSSAFLLRSQPCSRAGSNSISQVGRKRSWNGSARCTTASSTIHGLACG